MYYLRIKAATDAIKFTVDKIATEEPSEKAIKEAEAEALACSIENGDDCEACGS